jgi:hypothetical protein
MTEMEPKVRKLPRSLVAYSAILAALAFSLPFLYMVLYRQDSGLEQAAITSFVASFLWLIVLIYAFKGYGHAAMWLLAEAPFALYWPSVILLIGLACRFGDHCL